MGSWPWISSNCPIKRQPSTWGRRPQATNIPFRSILPRVRHGAATQHTGEETWLHIKSLLFHHTIDHQEFMVWLINKNQEAIQALHDRILEVVHQVMESAGKSAADRFRDCLASYEPASDHSITTGFPYRHTRAARVYPQGSHLCIPR